VNFKVDGSINPDGAATKNFFIIEDNIEDNASLLDIGLLMEIPFKFKMTGTYDRKDTIDFDFNDIVEESISKNIEDAKMILVFENGLPFDVKLSITALAEDGAKVGVSIIEGGAQIEGSRNGDPPTRNELSVSLTQEQLKQYREKKVKHLLVESSIATVGADAVQLTGETGLSIEMSFSATVNISSELF
jgi:hypothetical protein